MFRWSAFLLTVACAIPYPVLADEGMDESRKGKARWKQEHQDIYELEKRERRGRARARGRGRGNYFEQLQALDA